MSPLEPYQSDAFREMRKRVHSLSKPPTASPPRTHKQPSLPPSGTTSSVFVPHPSHSQSLKSPSPSPPLSEASPRSCPPSSSQTPLTQASDSSASSFDDIRMHQHRRSSRRATHKAHAWSGTHRRLTGSRSNLAQKRVFSEDDISSPRLAKRNRSQISPVHSKRRLYTGRSTSASLPLTSPTSLPSVASSWRRALKRQRKRHSDTAHAVRKARASSRTQTPGPDTQNRASAAAESVPRLDVLPELRLLSATRTAPIGWTRMASISNPLAHALEMYDESNAKRAPERQRFWPIVDHQLDYTGARMLSLSSASNGRLQLGTHFTKAAISLPIDEPVSPKSGVAPLIPSHTLPMQPGMASSDEDRSPLTPGACVEPPRASSTVSRYARDAVRNEPNRKPSVQLSPSATLAAMIDFTRAQHDRRQRQSAAHVGAGVEPERNAYGQPLRSPFSPPVACALAPHAPPRIAPRAAPTKDRDYFGHWESYLCGYSKESTF